jgi:hypothetical protein
MRFNRTTGVLPTKSSRESAVTADDDMERRMIAVDFPDSQRDAPSERL